MPRIISLEEKIAVIDDWLSGESRDDIATRHGIGSGTVYNIVQEWSSDFGVFQRADKLRELAINLKKNRLTVTDCARGLRMLMIFRKYGIKDEEEDQEKVINFIKEIYTRCLEVEFTPQQVFDYISDIMKFSSEIYISQIPQFIKKRIVDKEELETAIEKLSKKINELTNIRVETEAEIDRLLHIKETVTKTYNQFAIAKNELAKFGIRMENMSQFVKCVIGISKENYDPVQVLAKIADYEDLKHDSNYYKAEIILKKEILANLNQDIHNQKNELRSNNITLDTINQVEAMGFGIYQLRTLSNMLNKINEGNNQSFDGIRKEFFDDVKNYEDVFGSRREIDRLKTELKILEVQTMIEREKYNAYPKIIESIVTLSGAGITEDDIVKINTILSMTDYYHYKDKPISKEALIDDLKTYGNLKLAIKNLKDTEIDLKKSKKSKRRLLDKQTRKKSSSTVQ